MKIIQQQNTFCYAKFSAEMKKKKKGINFNFVVFVITA